MTQSEKGGRYYGWVIVFLGFMVMAVVFVASYSVNSLFVVPVCEDFGISRTTLSMYLTVSNIATLLSAPLIGCFMGKWGFRKVGTFCIVLLGLSFGALSFAPNIYVFYVIAVFRGIGFAGSTTTLVSTMVSNWFGPKQKGTATSISMLGSSVGGFIIMPIITRIIEVYGWQWGFRALCILVLVVMMPLMLGLAVETPEQKGLTRRGDISGVSRLYGSTVKEAQRLPAFWLMMIGIVLLSCACTALSTHSIAYLLDCGLNITLASGVQSMGLLIMIVGKVIIGRLNDKRSANTSMIFGFVTMTICFISMYAISFSKAFVPAYLIFYGLGFATGLLVPTIMVTKIFGNREFAGLIGYTTMANGIGSAIGPLILGSIYDLSGNYGIGWLLLAILSAVSMVLVICALRYDYRKIEAVA